MVGKVYLKKAIKNHFHSLVFWIILGPFVESFQKSHQYYTQSKLRKIFIFTSITWYLET